MANTFTTSAASVASDNLVTLARVKEYLSITGTDDDTKITNLIAAASRLTEQYCDRLFLSEARTEYRDGRSMAYLSLRAYPVTAGPKVRWAESALQIQNTNTTTLQAAWVKVESGVMTLTRTSTAGVDTASTLTLSSYATLALLSAAITAVGNGWSASTLTSYATYNPSTLRDTNAQLDALNNAVTVEGFFSGPSLSRVTPETGSVWFSRRLPDAPQTVRCDYTGGYTDLPDDLVAGVCAVTGALYRLSQSDNTLTSETLGDYSWTAAAGRASDLPSLAPDAAILLAAYKRPRFL